MKLKGVLELSLGNFLCLRGFAPMKVLCDISEPSESIQRDLLKDHRDEMVAFLDEGEFTFFPEVILCTPLSRTEETAATVDILMRNLQQSRSSVRLKFDGFRLSSSVTKTKSPDDPRAFTVFQTATLEIPRGSKLKFSRIDGNHRLSATHEKTKFEKYNTPFCLILFPDQSKADRLSRALFHNINYKQIPLTMEQNLRLILDDSGLFPDDKLKTNPSFGWPYYLARKLNNGLDFSLVPNLKPFIEKEHRTFFVRQFKFLIKKKVLKEDESAVDGFKQALAKVNALIDTYTALKDSTNPSVIAALLYYELENSPSSKSFVRWLLDNQLHLIESTSVSHHLQPDFIQIFDKILLSRKRTIFVSMKFGGTQSENHYNIIKRVCDEINTLHMMKPPLKVERVDWFHDGTSYEIDDKIVDMISDCGYLIANLTYCNPNVYHEVGLLMGKAKAEGKDSANMLLFLDESVSDEKDKYVAFNLKGIKQLRFTETEKFASDLKINLEKFFNLTV
jgi:hypothetical protein